MNRRRFSVLLLFTAACLNAGGQITRQVPFFKFLRSAVAGNAFDNFETYSAGVDLAALNGGTDWAAGYISNGALAATADDFESYTDAQDLSGLNGGEGWLAAFVSNETPSVMDNFEAYSDTADLNGLNGSTNWAAAYVSR